MGNSHAQEVNLEEDCSGYKSFGDAYPLVDGGEDQIKMVEDLVESVKRISSPPGSYEKKVKFFQSILPEVVEALREVEKERRDMLLILSKSDPVESDREKIEKLKKRYNAISNEDLMERVNIVPIDLILVQSAIETGWGESNAAKQCNNLVGIQKHGGLKVCDTPSQKIALFSSRKESFSTYLLAINRNPAYADLRKRRAEMLKNKEKFSGVELAPYLTKYSERPDYYVKEVRSFIQNHKLDEVITSALELSESCEFPAPAE